MIDEQNSDSGTLYIVATPIGNLEDITLRAIRILGEVDLIAAEDTRHSKRLLNHLGITTKLISYYREKEVTRSEQLITRLLHGENIALISDAGTPGISDPGAVLVKSAHESNVTVVPIPGPSALTTALSAAGLSSTEFIFLGFPPSKKAQRHKLLASQANSSFPLVFYESPHRIQHLLAECLHVFGDRQSFWARELTKAHEDLQYGLLSELITQSETKKVRGEFVLVVWPGDQEEVKGQTVEELLIWYKENTDLSLKDVSRRIADDLGTSRSQTYQTALKIWNNT